MSITYNGSSLSSYPGTGFFAIDLTGIFTTGGVMRLTLTSNVAAPGAEREFHFTTGGGRAPSFGTGYMIIGNTGDYIELTTQ